jgi:hypothetical protein
VLNVGWGHGGYEDAAASARGIVGGGDHDREPAVIDADARGLREQFAGAEPGLQHHEPRSDCQSDPDTERLKRGGQRRSVGDGRSVRDGRRAKHGSAAGSDGRLADDWGLLNGRGLDDDRRLDSRQFVARRFIDR